MIRNSRIRAPLSVSLIVLGGMLIFLVPDDVWIGAVLAALGVALELIAFTLLRNAKRDK